MKSVGAEFKAFLGELAKQNEDLKLSPSDRKYLKSVFEFGAEKHAGQTRASGQPYFFFHCVPVALKIAGLGYNIDMIAAGLLHDTIEDTGTTHKELTTKFGARVADLVEGVSKLGKLKYKGNERHVESMRKFFIAIASNTDVIVIKLCDRWHNLETLQYLSEEKQRRISQESILIHAQLASRLGMGQLVSTLNDLAFPYAFPAEFKKTKDLMDGQLSGEDETIKKVYNSLENLATPILGYQPVVDKRVKGVYSLYRKLERKNWNINEIYDLIAFRLIVKKPQDCYVALGAIHSHWRPVPGRVKDYIALPKPNGYKSLHTAIFSGTGPIVEIQIRSESMHRYNEYGIASHAFYKLSQEEDALTPQSVEWLAELGSFQQSSEDSQEYLENLRNNFFADRIFVLTPRGDVIDLPKGSTVLDFAYQVHSEIGDQAIGGKIDGKLVPLRTKLKSEQIVDVVTSARKQPSTRWLTWVSTSHARNAIRRRLTK